MWMRPNGGHVFHYVLSILNYKPNRMGNGTAGVRVIHGVGWMGRNPGRKAVVALRWLKMFIKFPEELQIGGFLRTKREGVEKVGRMIKIDFGPFWFDCWPALYPTTGLLYFLDLSRMTDWFNRFINHQTKYSNNFWRASICWMSNYVPSLASSAERQESA